MRHENKKSINDHFGDDDAGGSGGCGLCPMAAHCVDLFDWLIGWKLAMKWME